MKKIGIKILSLSLVVMMLLGLAPDVAFAASHSHKVCKNAEAHAVNETCNHADITDWKAFSVPTIKEGEYYPIIESGHYYLTGNVTTRTDVEIAADAEVVICLNGYTWDLSDEDGYYDGCVQLESNASLKICDCSSNQTGKLDGVLYPDGAKCNIELYSGEINGIFSKWGNCSFNMYGGKINVDNKENDDYYTESAIDIYTDDCDINIYGGTITGKEYAIYMKEASVNSQLNIYGGTITSTVGDNDASTVSYEGAVLIEKGEMTVNVGGNAVISGANYGIAFGENAKAAKLNISGNAKISSPYTAIYTYTTIDIAGTPTIDGGVYCAENPVYWNADPYPMFNITGAFEPKAPIKVYIEDPNFVIVKNWSKRENNKEISDCFYNEDCSFEYDATEDEVVATGEDVILKTNAIKFANGNIIEFTYGASSGTLLTVKDYGANDETSAKKYTVTVYDSGSSYVNVEGSISGNVLCLKTKDGSELPDGKTYEVSITEDGKTESIKVEVTTKKVLGKPDTTILPTIDTETPGVLKFTNTLENTIKLYWKIVGPDGEPLIDWDDKSFSGKRTEVIAPLDGGNYTIYFCVPDAMDSGEPINDDYVVTVPVTIKDIPYEANKEVTDGEFVLDFGNCVDYGYIQIGSSANIFYKLMNSDEDDFDMDYITKNLAAKYYSYDYGLSWYKLPEAEEIVVVNTSKDIIAYAFEVYEDAPVYGFDVTFRDLSVYAVYLGSGDAVVTIEGDVTIEEELYHYGNLEIKGEGKDDSLTVNGIEVRMALEDSGKLIISGLDELNVVGEGATLYAENDIEISDVNKIVVDNPAVNTSSSRIYYGIQSKYGDVKIDEVGSLRIEVYGIGINGTNVSLNAIGNIEILAERAGIMAYPAVTPSSESEMPGIGNLSITDCGTIKISGTRWIMPTSDDEPVGEMKPVRTAIAGLVIEIDGVESLTINDATVGIMSEAEDASSSIIELSNIAAMNIVGEIYGIGAKGDVKLDNVVGTVIVTEVNGGKAVISAGGKIFVTHNNKISVVSGSSKEDTKEMTLTDNVVDMEKMGSYFEIIRTFTFESFIEEVKATLAELLGNNDTTEDNIKAIIQELVDATGEEGLSFTMPSFTLNPAKDSTDGSIDLVIEFTYEEEGEEAQEATVEAEIKIPLRVYVEDRYNDLGNALTDIFDKPITSANKVLFKNALEIAEELLKEANAACLDEDEKEEVEAVRDYLEENIALIEDSVESLLAELREKYNALPTNDKVTSADVEKIVEAGLIAEELLQNYAENLTAEEKAEVESKNQALYEKYEIIAVIAEKLEAAKDAFDALPADGAVTSENKEAVSAVLAMLDELLAKEGNLTAEEKAEVEAMKAALEKKLAIIKDVADKMKEVEDALGKLPANDKVTSKEKETIDDALDIIDELLSDELAGNLTPEEKEKVTDNKTVLEENLSIIEDTAKELADVKDALSSIPEDNKVKPSDEAAIKAALDKVKEFLGSDVANNLTAEEKAELEAMKAALEKKLAIIDNVAKELSDFVEKETALPEVDAITSDDKSAVEGLLNSINEFKNTYAGNLTDEQKAQVEILIASLEKKLDKIKELETKIDKIEDDVEAQPTYKDVTSENKEDIKDVIGNIDEVLANNKDNLSEEEIKDLQDQKKELEDMVEFIEKIEKYEPVAGDFENTTDSDENDKKGNLVNKSEELITIIPLDKIEKQHVAKGEKVQVYLVVTDISETVSNDDKDLIDEAIGDKEVGAYIDLTLFKQIGDRSASKVPNTNGMVQITVEVPAELLAANANATGKYQIVRVHEGETTIIDTVFDEATGTITFETDKFSTYALVYETAVETPDTGDSTNAIPTVALLFVGIAMVVVARKRSLKAI